MAGTVQHEGRIYSIRHLGGEMHAVVEMGEDRMPQEHAPMPERMRATIPTCATTRWCNRAMPACCGRNDGMRPASAAGEAADQARPSEAGKAAPGQKAEGRAGKDVVIDVIVAYTKKAASNYADVKRELVDLSIEEANKSFRMSNLGNVKLRLVHAYQTDYVEEGAHFDHVWRFADKGDGYMEEIHGLRDKYQRRRRRADRRRSARAAGWPRACMPMPTRHSRWCTTSARPPPTRSRTRSATSSARATISTSTRS